MTKSLKLLTVIFSRLPGKKQTIYIHCNPNNMHKESEHQQSGCTSLYPIYDPCIYLHEWLFFMGSM